MARNRPAKAIFGKGSAKGQAWYDKYRSKLKDENDGVRALTRSMAYHARTGKASPTRRKALATEQTFFRRNAHRMDYARFRRNGWPIGSGPIEAACKSVVKTRLCRSGMRWSRTGGQHVLSLRRYVKSRRWDGMWNQYKRIERHAYSKCHVETSPHPNEVYEGRDPGNENLRFEPRSRLIRGSPCAKTETPIEGKPGDRLIIKIDKLDGRSQLPIISIKRAA